MKDKFEEVKIKMIMKLKKCTRAEAEFAARVKAPDISRPDDDCELLSADLLLED